MESFLLKNVTKYNKLVEKLRKPQPLVSTGEAGPNMIVGARIRPLSADESFPSAIFPRSDQKTVLDIHDLYNHPKGMPVLKSSTYQVDRLFKMDSTTEEVYEQLVAGLVPFAWNGGIGTLFAYGQTGSGKTFTVSGLEELVAGTLMDGSLKGERQIYMTIVDLAGNSAFDLLNERTPISILEDAFGETQLEGAAEYQVSDKENMKKLIERANSFRQTASTFRNDASSRSHAVCRIRIRDPAGNSDGLLYMIDLAGSESARDTTMHRPDRMRETREINKSLSVLKDCIRIKAEADAIASSGKQKKMPYVPSRQSDLTRVLKHVFDPTHTRACKTVVIACVNPSLADVGSSKNTLRFAETLRVLVPATGKTKLDPMAPMTWTNAHLKGWIKENSGSPPILSNILAPEESGSQLLHLSNTDFDFRCLQCPGVTPEQALAFRSKLWQMHIDSQRTGMSGKKAVESNPGVSSREMDPIHSSLPFKDRLRSGMVVRYTMPLELEGDSGLLEDQKLAVLLSPTGVSDEEQFLCAVFIPGQKRDGYELRLWKQVVISVGSMTAEVHMEYDTASRLYYISV